MKELTSKEHKETLIKMLDFINKICVKNNINYTLIGGSLIGAVRHKGIIPWDDDIDIGLLHDDYVKLLELLRKNENQEFKLFDDCVDGYYYPYAKLVSQKTILVEENLKKIENYGAFIDIFEYNYTHENYKKRKQHYKRIKIKQTLIGGYFNIRKDKNILRNIRRMVCDLLGIKFILKLYNKEVHRYNEKKTDYLISNWPQYGMQKEIMKREYFEEFMLVKFDGIDAMITKKYDEMLKDAFGDYMTPPPIEKRIAHNIKVYWRE